jgi:hypothetical protein
MLQELPLKCSMNCPDVRRRDVDHPIQYVRATQAIPGEGAAAGIQGGETDHVLPFQCSAKVAMTVFWF